MPFDTCEGTVPKPYWLASVVSIVSTFNEESNALNVGRFTISDLMSLNTFWCVSSQTKFTLSVIIARRAAALLAKFFTNLDMYSHNPRNERSCSLFCGTGVSTTAVTRLSLGLIPSGVTVCPR